MLLPRTAEWSASNVEYRLAPQFPWPAGNEDLAAAVRLVVDKAADFGADPNRIYLMGHSAGATHVASYVSHPEFFGSRGFRTCWRDPLIWRLSISRQANRATGGLRISGAIRSLLAQRSAVAGLIKTKFLS